MKYNSVCYFGSFDKNYSRNRIIIDGLEKNFIKVHQCFAQGNLIVRYLSLIRQYHKIPKDSQIIIVGFPGHFDMPLAYILGKIYQKKIYFDIFASTYETYIIDRKVVNKYTLRSLWFFFVDLISLKLANYVIVDTCQHSKLYNQLFGLNLNKVIKIYVGADENIFKVQNIKSSIDVLFYGSYQPLQGVEVIIKAAQRLPKVKFLLIGHGLTKPKIEKMVKNLNIQNIQFINWLPINELADKINSSKITLGIFGDSLKAQSVIPNKLYDSLACKKLVITKKTPATDEVFGQKNDSVVCTNDDLSNTIQYYLKNKNLRDKIAANGYKMFVEKFTSKKIVLPLLNHK